MHGETVNENSEIMWKKVFVLFSVCQSWIFSLWVIPDIECNILVPSFLICRKALPYLMDTVVYSFGLMLASV